LAAHSVCGNNAADLRDVDMNYKNVAFLCLTLFSANAYANCPGTSPIDRQLSLAEESAAPIQSEAGLLDYLNAMPQNSPLRAFSDDAMASFVASLRFNEKGLTSFSTIEMERELTLGQAYDVLSLLGAQRSARRLPIPIQGERDSEIMKMLSPRCEDHHYSYQCVGTGTCKTSASSICTPKC